MQWGSRLRIVAGFALAVWVCAEAGAHQTPRPEPGMEPGSEAAGSVAPGGGLAGHDREYIPAGNVDDEPAGNQAGTPDDNPAGNPEQEREEQNQENGDLPTLPRGFRNLTFGLTRDEAMEELYEDPGFDFRGDPDVSFRGHEPGGVIDTDGFDFIDRGVFQFYEDRLYLIILSLDGGQLDYFTLYRTLSDRYGMPTRLDPSQAVWEREGVRLALERPVSVKYLDMEVFDRIREEGRARETERGRARREFLEEF